MIEPMQETILELAPGAHLVRLAAPPVLGAVLLGMEAGGLEINPDIREKLKQSLA